MSIAENQAVNDTDEVGKSWKEGLQYRIKWEKHVEMWGWEQLLKFLFKH